MNETNRTGGQQSANSAATSRTMSDRHRQHWTEGKGSQWKERAHTEGTRRGGKKEKEEKELSINACLNIAHGHCIDSLDDSLCSSGKKSFDLCFPQRVKITCFQCASKLHQGSRVQLTIPLGYCNAVTNRAMSCLTQTLPVRCTRKNELAIPKIR